MFAEQIETQSAFDLCLRTMNLALIRSDRFCYDNIKCINNELNKIITKHFDKQSIEILGLKHAYHAMANDIYISEPYIVGALTSHTAEDIPITNYTTQSGEIILLTRTGILDELLRYLDKEKIIDMCFKTPQYKMYYKYCIDHSI